MPDQLKWAKADDPSVFSNHKTVSPAMPCLRYFKEYKRLSYSWTQIESDLSVGLGPKANERMPILLSFGDIAETGQSHILGNESEPLVSDTGQLINGFRTRTEFFTPIIAIFWV